MVNTHLHIDHVGWNTYLDGRTWVPTFPNATYLMPRRDFDFWNPANGHEPRLGRGNQNVFEDSVAPVHQAGLAELWDGSYRIDKNLRLESAPGHTPGSSVLTLESGPDRALFVGDMVHTALQIMEPDTNSCFCEDPVQARATRHKLLGRAAESNALVFPAHLGGHGAAEVDQGRLEVRDQAVGRILPHRLKRRDRKEVLPCPSAPSAHTVSSRRLPAPSAASRPIRRVLPGHPVCDGTARRSTLRRPGTAPRLVRSQERH